MRKLNVTDGQTDRRGALQYLPSRAFGAAGDKNKGAKNHTQKKRSKSDNHEARYRLKRTPKHTKYANKILVRWGGGGGGHKGKYFVHKSNIKVILLIVSLLSSNI